MQAPLSPTNILIHFLYLLCLRSSTFEHYKLPQLSFYQIFMQLHLLNNKDQTNSKQTKSSAKQHLTSKPTPPRPSYKKITFHLRYQRPILNPTLFEHQSLLQSQSIQKRSQLIEIHILQKRKNRIMLLHEILTLAICCLCLRRGWKTYAKKGVRRDVIDLMALKAIYSTALSQYF